MKERKTRKGPVYSIDQKNEIAREYLEGEGSLVTLSVKYNIHHSMIRRWLKQVDEHGTTVDNRGRGTKQEIPNKGRPKSLKLEEMNKAELIQYIQMMEDIKKTTVYLRSQKKSIK